MIKINASDVASLIGENKYQIMENTLLKIWYNTNKYQAKNIFKKYGKHLINSNNILNKINIDRENNSKNSFDKMIFIATELPTDQLSTQLNLIKNEANKEGLNKVTVDEIQSRIFKKRGINAEKYILDNYEEKQNINITDRNKDYMWDDIQFYYNNQKYTYILAGMIDGIDLKNKRIIEAKNRVRKIMYNIPKYEIIQTHVYMYLWSMEECELVQSYGDQTHTTIIAFDQHIWSNIIKKLNTIVFTLNMLINGDKDIQKKIITKATNLNFLKKNI